MSGLEPYLPYFGFAAIAAGAFFMLRPQLGNLFSGLNTTPTTSPSDALDILVELCEDEDCPKGLDACRTLAPIVHGIHLCEGPPPISPQKESDRETQR